MSQRIALVTGGGSGIGRAIVAALSSSGYVVAVNDIDPEAAAGVATAHGGTALPGDVTSDGAAIVERTAEVLGGLHALVNCAGISVPGMLATITEQEVMRVLRLNTVAPLMLSQAALPHLEQSKGAIVNIASVGARSPAIDRGAYSASKAALVALTRQAAVEWGSRGVRVNAVAPGAVLTPLTASRFESGDPAPLVSMIPQGRLTTADEVAAATAFLLSEQAAGITGEVLTVDGGFSNALVATFAGWMSQPPEDVPARG